MFCNASSLDNRIILENQIYIPLWDAVKSFETRPAIILDRKKHLFQQQLYISNRILFHDHNLIITENGAGKRYRRLIRRCHGHL